MNPNENKVDDSDDCEPRVRTATVPVLPSRAPARRLLLVRCLSRALGGPTVRLGRVRRRLMCGPAVCEVSDRT